MMIYNPRMNVFFVLTLIAALSFSSLPSALAANNNDEIKQPEAYQQRLVDWIRAGPNGYFHPSIVWKRLGPDGKSGSYAMHTTEDLPKGTTLMVVPRSYVIDSFKTYSPCVTVARMLEEFETKGDESLFAPYLSYLFDDTAGGTSPGLLPASWSNQGQDLLSFILDKNANGGRGLEPKRFEQPSVFEKCGSNFRSDNQYEQLKRRNSPTTSRGCVSVLYFTKLGR